LQKDYEDWVFQTGELRLRANLTLKKFAAPDVSEADFIRECLAEAQKQRDKDVEKTGATLRRKKEALQQKLAKEESELAADQRELTARTTEEVGAGLQTVLGLFGGRKRSVNTNLTKRRMTANAKADVEESEKMIALLKKQIADMDQEISQANAEITQKWEDIAADISELPLLPTKTNIFLEIFGVAWKP
jgi:DNA repair exonuclease SbcCD ATPase subunit